MTERDPGRLVTAEELLAFPEDASRHELQEGFVVEEPPPLPRHARTVARLAALLGPIAKASGAVVVTDFFLILARGPDTVRAPDLAVFTGEQWKALDPDRPYQGAPALVIEVLSPSNRPGDMHAKIADYLAAGVSLVWVVDPWAWSVRSYRTLLSPVLHRGEAQLEGGSVLPDLELRAQDLFDPDLPSPTR
jgi:Uma2 family endonuclease